MSKKPYYATENAFRLYEPIIIQAIASVPNAISFTSAAGARRATTDAARCRDALSSWRVRRWSSAIAPHAAIVATLRTWTYKERVFIGQKHAFMTFVTAQQFAESHNRAFDISSITHYHLDHQLIKNTMKVSPESMVGQRLLFDPRIASRPLLMPKPFPTEAPVTSGAEPVLASVSVIPNADISTPRTEKPAVDLRALVEQLDSGKIAGQHLIDYDRLDEVIQLTTGRLNVAYGIRGDKIVLF